MTDDELTTLMADYLDDLLDEEEAKEAEAQIARAPALLAEVARRRALLYRPYPVPPPAPGQTDRIRARLARRPGLARLARYAAIFLAGIVTALLVETSVAPPSRPPTPVHPSIDDEAPPAPALGRRVLR